MPRSKPSSARSPRRTPARRRSSRWGRTAGGRRLWAIEIAAPGAAPPASRPGILLVANLAADQIAGSTLALGIARALLTSSDEAVRRQLAACVFYIVPRLDADGTEAVFAPLQAPRRGNLTPFDDDNDGRLDEDPPEDLNGDGVITDDARQGPRRAVRAVAGRSAADEARRSR